jgi:hypothetical protein
MAAGLAAAAEIGTERWRAEVAHYLPLIARVIVQTRRRVLDREIVAGINLQSASWLSFSDDFSPSLVPALPA